MIEELLIVAASYLVGSIPAALIVVHLVAARDVREVGSGNVGASNATRAAGLGVGAMVTVLDIAKGAFGVLLMRLYNPADAWLVAAMIAAVLGHCFPLWLRFRGGKGVATAFGCFLVLAPLAAAITLAAWLVVLAIWRWVSLASLVAGAAFPIVLAAVAAPSWPVLVSVSAVAVLIILRHTSNVRNLVAGSEPRIGRGDRGAP